MADIETRITVLESTANTLLIKFDLINNTGNDVRVLKRNTPLEGLKSDCLIVMVDGNRIKYDGYFVKRSVPIPSEYTLVPKGGTISSMIDVSDAYDVSLPGTYEIKFDDRKLVLVADSSSDIPLSSENKISRDFLNIANEPTAVPRTYESSKMTIGQLMRAGNTESLFDEKQRGAPGTLKKPKILGGTEDQKKTIETAHKNAYRYIKKAIKEFRNDNRYRRWFGYFIDERAEHVMHVLERMKTRMEKVEFSYHINGSICAKGDYAYTTIGSYVIWLCFGFWESEDEGFESRAGTLVHEHSHASGSTDDFEYSSADCAALARSEPATAIINADNYEYYTESHFI